ncbi:MAG: tetratricopeptide repeat protein [Planctomycetes bacterium]|nr:tetratricopeptide repeat protein [Planctomycetota bacterium]
MIRERRPRRLLLLMVSIALAAEATAQAPEDRPLVPESFELADAALRAISAPWLTEEERAELHVFHGVGDERDLLTPATRARDALNAWRLDDPALVDPAAPVAMRGEALVRRGELREAIALLAGERSIAAGRLRAEAHEGLGEYDEALREIKPIITRLLRDRLEEAADLTDGVAALTIRARIEGQPGRDYQSMITLLSRVHQELDRLYWPALLAEAELLLAKSNRREGVTALHQALELNPRCAEAWHRLGRAALARFDFDGAQRAVEALRRIDRQHPLSHLLHAESRLVQNDPEEAVAVLEKVTSRWPKMRRAHALMAAATALLYDPQATRAALARCDELSPGSADAWYTAGRFLSMFRQYDAAAELLDEAILRQPGWPAPQIELGLMEMQSGRDARARDVLQAVVELDRFNKRATNSLALLEEIAEYRERETEHFVIRYRPGIDEVMVDLMPEPLDHIHEVVSDRFGWETGRKTIIELMPDHKRFAVRITGMPHIHTIAACTGPIIALEAPREGPPSMHRGTFDWRRVLQHEYTHTITLDQTRFRIPHWLTEAAAVSMEHAPRDYGQCTMLARSWREGTLFDLDDIKWAFVRPRRPGDRGKAYAQGHWMVEFMNERFGPSALVRLLARYFEGEREEQAMLTALGISRARFFQEFIAWAGEEVKAWGLVPEPSMLDLADELRWSDPELSLAMAASRQARLDAIVGAMTGRVGEPASPGERPFTADQWPDLVRPPVKVDDDQLDAWLTEHPDHPELLAEWIRRRIDALGEPDASLVEDLTRLTRLRPVDMFPHRKLAQIHLAGPDPLLAIPHLEELDVRDEKTPVFARQLATLYRDSGDLDAALAKASRAVSVNPYHAGHRELAAAIAIESRQLEVARMHVKALMLLEPGRAQHERRMQRLDELIGDRSRN